MDKLSPEYTAVTKVLSQAATTKASVDACTRVMHTHKRLPDDVKIAFGKVRASAKNLNESAGKCAELIEGDEP